MMDALGVRANPATTVPHFRDVVHDYRASLTYLARERARGEDVSVAIAMLSAGVSMSALVADGRSRAVLAAVSGDGRAGSMDLTTVSRSPGSALKPLLYGVAFQDGLVTPGTPRSW